MSAACRRPRPVTAGAADAVALQRGFVGVLEEERRTFMRHLNDMQTQLDAGREDRKRLVRCGRPSFDSN